MDIAAFLNARLDEDQAAAELAQRSDPAPWIAYGGDDDASTQERTGHGAAVVIAADQVALWDCEGSNMLCMTASSARHIARHDPLRVLAEIEAKRAILARHHADSPNLRSGSTPSWRIIYACVGCGFDNQEERMVDDINECPELRDLASIHADHPDYTDTWPPVTTWAAPADGNYHLRPYQLPHSSAECTPMCSVEDRVVWIAEGTAFDLDQLIADDTDTPVPR